MRQEIMERLNLNTALTIDLLTSFLAEEVRKADFERAVLGLSGGIDSALVAYLATRALGRENVFAVLMPYRTSSAASLSDAAKVVEDLGIAHATIPITEPVDAYFRAVDKHFNEAANALRRGNRMARERMATLFDFSAALRGLVLGTSNKTELLLGYGTQFGDMASALNPIGDLFKCQVRQLSKAVGVPKSILDKTPSADLWENQSDETELGFAYDFADEILYQLVDMRRSLDEMVALGYERGALHEIMRRVQGNQYKRLTPIIAKLSQRTIGVDFRYLRDIGR